MRRTVGRAASRTLGPAFIASVAYVDPGNFATNIEGGSRYGYLLLWVVLAANLTAMGVQYLAAKLGVVTGRGLADLLGRSGPRPVTWVLWAQAEIVAMATDVAEFVGAALGLELLFGLPPLAGGLLTAVIAFGLLSLRRIGYRRFEAGITALLAVVLVGFGYETLSIGPDARASLHGLVPSLGGGSVYLAAGILGATVMPHVIYLHSALAGDRVSGADVPAASVPDGRVPDGRVLGARVPDGRGPGLDGRERGRVLRRERGDIFAALGLAGLVNMAMLAVAARLFHVPGLAGLSSIARAHAELGRLAGGAAATVFAVALLAAGLSSASVGTFAGQAIMTGFLGRRIPVLARRGITMIPALVILGVGVDPTSALVLSQVVLSFGIPFALVPLVAATGRRSVMGACVNRPLTAVLAWSAVALICGLNVFLLLQYVLAGLTLHNRRI